MEQAAKVVGFTLALLGPALLGSIPVADAREPLRLTGAQLDRVNAGKAGPDARGSGTGEAHGAEAAVTVEIQTAAGSGPPVSSFASGQVVSTASAQATGINATASSSLSLRITGP